LRFALVFFVISIFAIPVSAGFLPPAAGGRVIFEKYDAGKCVTYALDFDTGEMTPITALETKGGGGMWLMAFTPDWGTLLLADSFTDNDSEEPTIGIYVLNFGEAPELVLNWKSVPGADLETVYDETGGIFYIGREYDIFDGENQWPKTQVFKYELRTGRATLYAEFGFKLWLAGGFFDGNPYVTHTHYYSQENAWEKYYGYIGKEDGEIRDLGFVLRNNEPWMSHPVVGGPDEKRSVPPYFYVRKRIDVPGEFSDYNVVYVCDPDERDYYRVVLVQWAKVILYSPKADALVYISYLEGNDRSPKIVVRPVEKGIPWKIFPLSDERTPGYNYDPDYSLVAVE